MTDAALARVWTWEKGPLKSVLFIPYSEKKEGGRTFGGGGKVPSRLKKKFKPHCSKPKGVHHFSAPFGWFLRRKL